MIYWYFIIILFIYIVIYIIYWYFITILFIYTVIYMIYWYFITIFIYLQHDSYNLLVFYHYFIYLHPDLHNLWVFIIILNICIVIYIIYWYFITLFFIYTTKIIAVRNESRVTHDEIMSESRVIIHQSRWFWMNHGD